MRCKFLGSALLSLLLSNFPPSISQNSTVATITPQSSRLLEQSARALSNFKLISDVTLAGTVEWTAGSTDEVGTVTYKGLPEGFRLDMSFRGGSRSESVLRLNGIASGTEVDFDGTPHPIAFHNLIVEAGWFPLFALQNFNSSSNTLVTNMGIETHNDLSVIHIRVVQEKSQQSDETSVLVQHLSQVEIYLDPASLLPISYAFNLHPENDAGRDLLTEIRYSDYQNFGGVQIPFHVEEFINNYRTLDLKFQSALLNSGITSAQISTQ